MSDRPTVSERRKTCLATTMFEPTDHPRIYGLAPGVDFPKALIHGLLDRHTGQPPEALAHVHLIVNTRRMARRIRTLFDNGPARLLPRIGLVTDLGNHWHPTRLPDPVPSLRRRLELIQLISALLDRQPDIAPRTALYDLADSLAALMDEMHGEGVDPDAIDALDITDQSGHWDRIKSFLGIVRHYFDGAQRQPDVETRQRMMVEHLIGEWRDAPPHHPVIIAGSTGSRGATRLLMEAVSKLPQGAVVLPGFDFDMPGAVWQAMDERLLSEDHPQYRFQDLLTQLGLTPDNVAEWTDAPPPNTARNRVLSLALRPAPVTDQWRRDGPSLTGINDAMRDVTLLEAPGTRTEALAIAMRLRQAAEDGQTAALITPDRMLTRQVTAALDRWNIIPDDSAGIPLHLSPPGRFLRHVADLFRTRLSAETLLTILKHPLTHSGRERGPHLRLTHELELHLRHNGPPYPSETDLKAWAVGRRDAFAPAWVEWLCSCLIVQDSTAEIPLETRVDLHLTLAERIAQGCQETGSGALWRDTAGQEARKAADALREEAPHGGTMVADDYARLFHAVLAQEELRNPDAPHPHIRIWGTLEARVQGADLLILAGLNEGSWPAMPNPDPWLNRALRNQAGLLLPERRIGLQAHDFQQAASAREVWLTRSIRSDDAETVASRWLNRLQNLLSGLPDQEGVQALHEMRARGELWLSRARRFEQPESTPAAPRPAPAPPAETRPKRLSVTEIKRLVRDPYAIYAKHVLRLKPLDPLMKVPDALLRGIVLHEVLEGFIRDTIADPACCSRECLIRKTEAILAQSVPWAETRALWLARIERVADWLVDTEMTRRSLARPVDFETFGSAELADPEFTLTAKADRIDRDSAGHLHIYDYKTGAPPSQDEQTHFDKQLLLEAAIAERAGFGDLGPAPVARAVFIGLGGDGKEVSAPLGDEPPEKVWQEFRELIAAYADESRGYMARRAPHSTRDHGDYDQLARFGEWDITDTPTKESVR